MHYDAATKGFIFHEHKWELAVIFVYFSQKMLQQAIYYSLQSICNRNTLMEH